MTRRMLLGEVGSYFNGKAFRPDDWSEDGMPIVRIANLNNATAPFNHFRGHVRPEQRADDGDLLVSWSASLDAYIWRGGPAVVNQHIFKVYEREDFVERRYLWYALRAAMRQIRSQVHGATMQHITKPEFEAISIPVPPRSKQRDVIDELDGQLAMVEHARVAAANRNNSSRSLALILLTGALLEGHADWPRRPLCEIAETKRSPSVSADGDTSVITVTSGCLTPFGFAFEGLGRGRMSSHDAVAGVVSADEVLVARSNTEAFVGRAARYPGGEQVIVASDLVFRLVPDPASVSSVYLADYLAALQLDGYWRDRSSGASSTMKKIKKSALLDVDLPLPSLSEQLRIVDALHKQLDGIDAFERAARAETAAIEALTTALLRSAFADLAA